MQERNPTSAPRHLMSWGTRQNSPEMAMTVASPSLKLHVKLRCALSGFSTPTCCVDSVKRKNPPPFRAKMTGLQRRSWQEFTSSNSQGWN